MREAALRALGAAPIAHRGLHGCGRPGGPIENSIGAAHAAAAAGFGIECDIQLSRDGEAMVFHDDRLERLTNATGDISDHDAATLTTIALGGTTDRIPTLPNFLDAIAGRTPLVIEIKSRFDGDLRLAERACALVDSYRGCVALESFDPAIVARCRALTPACPIGLVGPLDADLPTDENLVDVCDFLSWSIDHIARIAVRFPQKPLTTWTVRTPQQQQAAERSGAQIVFEGFTPVTKRKA